MATMSVEQFTRMQELKGKANLTASEASELVNLTGLMQATTSEARETIKESGLTIATDAQLKIMTGVAESLTFNLEGNLRYFYEVVLGNTLARYNGVAASLNLPQYNNPLDLYENLDKLPPIFSSAVREGRTSGRTRYNKSWGEALDQLNKDSKTPKGTRVEFD